MTAKTNFHRLLILILPLCLCGSILLTNCNNGTPEGTLERNKQLVREMNAEVWNKTNIDILDRLFTPDFVMHFLPDGSELRGIDSLREHILEHYRAFPDWKENIIRIIVEQDLVMIQYISTGTNKGNWLGEPPTGRSIQINEVSIFQIQDGKICEQWLLPDLLSMQQQLAGTGNQ